MQPVTPQPPQVVEPAAQLCEPVPLAMAQLSDPAGLVHDCVVAAAPHTAECVGVHDPVVAGDPVQLGVPVRVQLWPLDGLLPALQKLSATVLPRLSWQVTDRDCEPEPAFQPQLDVRDCEPLFALKLHVALRDCVPVPLHTADALQLPHEP